MSNTPTNDNQSLGDVHSSVNPENLTGWKKLMAFLGPAYLVSVGYMDPGNWATDIAGGSAFGYKLIWVLFASNLIALLLQSLAARLGIVRGLRSGTGIQKRLSTLCKLLAVYTGTDSHHSL
jgi:manganese transport protein